MIEHASRAVGEVHIHASVAVEIRELYRPSPIGIRHPGDVRRFQESWRTSVNH